jgi:hypothetical protein
MSFDSRYAKEKKKKKFWDEDNDPDEGHHSKLSPEQKAKAKARAKAHGRPYPNKVDNVWAAREASVITAGAYPNADHLKQIIAELKDAVNHCDQGNDWHSERGETEMAQHHDDAAEALSVAIESLEKVIRDGDAGMPVSEETEKTAKKHEDHYQYIKERDGKWVILQKGTGKVLSHHDTREKAIAAFKAMMASKHGSLFEAAISCLGCGRKKGSDDGKCSKQDGPECKAYQRDKIRGNIDAGDETPRN